MLLYKYVSADRVDVLANLQVRFLQPVSPDCNDLFEFDPNTKGIAPEDVLVRSVGDEYLRRQGITNTNLARGSGAECAASIRAYLAVNNDPEIAKSAERKLYEGIKTDYGMLCLSGDGLNQAMWAHYANNYRGFVICFDSENEWFTRKWNGDAQYCLGRVKYELQMKKYATEKSPLDVLFSKHPVWEYEDEWRYVVPVKYATRIEAQNALPGNPVYLFDYPGAAVRMVILGCRMSGADKQNVTCAIRKNNKLSHCEIKELVVNMESYGLGIRVNE